jgi:diaminopimelate decarboxylase
VTSVLNYNSGQLHLDSISLTEIAEQVGTPTYVYSIPRILQKLSEVKAAFAPLQAHIHYSIKANANLRVIDAIHQAGAGVDAVSWGEIHRALHVGISPKDIVFAGVGKTPEELRLAVEAGVGWFNVENVDECQILNDVCGSLGKRAQVALRYNPGVQANTHAHIATGHKTAKFGLNQTDLRAILDSRHTYPNLEIVGIHVHVGSQLGDTNATTAGVRAATEIADEYGSIHTINIGGGFPVSYTRTSPLPSFSDFADALEPLLRGRKVIVEPGRSIVADAGVLLCRLLYIKAQGGETLYIVDASMTELMRPALYNANHNVLSLVQRDEQHPVTVVGPVCESADVIRRHVALPTLQSGELLAILDVGAYGMVMANTYNQRPRPAEVIVEEDGKTWNIARRRETYTDMVRFELAAT